MDEHDKCLLLRHDVDFSPIKAYEMAKVENRIGVKSTYFVLLSTEFYNIFSINTYKVLQKILDLRHEIGLHFDEQRYNSDSLDNLQEQIISDSEILGKALGTKIKVVSMHRPSKSILDESLNLNGLINSYDSEYFKSMKYF
ncbi:MAG: hypothetical protein ACVCEJ_07125 [Candidatus Izemoplasmataceae bacterium]